MTSTEIQSRTRRTIRWVESGRDHDLTRDLFDESIASHAIDVNERYEDPARSITTGVLPPQPEMPRPVGPSFGLEFVPEP